MVVDSEPAGGCTHWDFTDMDPFVLDYWNATGGDHIMGFCTAPTWLYSPESYLYTDDASTPWYIREYCRRDVATSPGAKLLTRLVVPGTGTTSEPHLRSI